MNVQFKNSDGGITSRLQERIERKLTKLSRMTDTPENQANAFFEIERSVGSHQTGDVWQATLNIDSNGNRFHARELSETPEKAADKVLYEVRVELKKAHGKKRAIAKREGGIWKAFTQRVRGS